MRFLLFTLYGPFAAHGEVAVGERRMGWDRPGRSAILGLVAAALGHEREDEAAHRHLDDGLWYAVRSDSPGRPWVDYHTTNVPSTRRNRTYATRREELADGDYNTILSTREWRSDALYTIVLWSKPDSSVDLDAIATALTQPHFVLYMGRKAGPLGWPPCPRILEADSLLDALRQDSRDADTVRDHWLHRPSVHPTLAYDAEAQGFGAPPPDRVVTRRDRLVSRARWQFAEREEGILDDLSKASP